MEVPSGHTPRLNWRLWCSLVSTGSRNRTHEVAWVIHRLHRHILLGALRRPDKTPFHAAWPNSQLRAGQLDYLDHVASAYICVWKNRRTTSRRGASELDFDRVGRDLYNAGARFILRSHPRNRRGARANASTSLPGPGTGSLRLDLW